MAKIDISEIIRQATIGCIACVVSLLWTIDNIYIKFFFMVLPTLCMLLAFIIIFFEPDFLEPYYSIFQSVINALLYTVVYCVLLVGEFSPTASLPFQYTFPAKIFLYLAIPFYYIRLENSYSVNFLPFGPIVGSLLSSYLYITFSNAALFIGVGILTQILFNAFLFPLTPVKINKPRKVTEQKKNQ